MKKLFIVLSFLVIVTLTACGKEQTISSKKTNSNDSSTSNEFSSDTTKTIEPTATYTPVNKWPDNEYTQKLPDFPFTLISQSTSEPLFCATFSDATSESLNAYSLALQDKGFNIDVKENTSDDSSYSFKATNSDGWTIELDSNPQGSGSLYLTMKTE